MVAPRRLRLIRALFLILCFGARSWAEPLDLRAVETLLKGKVSQQRIVKLVKERKTSITLTAEGTKRLRRIGASDALVEAIRRNCFAEVLIGSDPSGAEIFIDGRYRGKTPLRVGDLAPGGYELQVGRVEGYGEYVDRLRVEPGRTERTVRLVAGAPATPSVPPPAASPVGAAADRPAAPGQVPASGPATKPTGAPAGAPARPAPHGAPAGERDEPGERAPEASVTVRTEPVQSSLFLDDRYVGITPISFLAAVGTHRLRLVPTAKTQYETVEKEIAVDRHRLNVVFLRLSTRRD